MQEKIGLFNAELASINLVLDKLVTRQNSSVFDKLCIKCNGLLNNISSAIPEISTSEERNQIKDILIRMRESAIKLSNYKEYLIASINNNISKIEEATLDNTPQETMTVTEPKVLTLQNNVFKDAA